jgi:hydrogenase/urease accessory protein HupE
MQPPAPRAVWTALVWAWLAAAAPAAAHPAPFSYLDVHLAGDALTGRLVVHDIDAAHDLGVPVGEFPDRLASHADALVRLLQPRLRLIADGAPRPWTAVGVQPAEGGDAIAIEWRAAGPPPGRLQVEAALFPYDPNHQTFVTVYERGVLLRQDVLDAGRTTAEYYSGSRQGLWAVFTAFTAAGIHHIAIGPDHILFIIGLLLLGGSIRRLLAIVTAFTAGHSVTLALAALGILSPPASLVEPAIALSIVYVGADNLIAARDRRDARPWIALFFGLVHGFGFASVLREIGLPPRALGLSLFSFNLGVEIGQAVIVVAVSAALNLVRGRSTVLAARQATAGSVVVMLAGAFWFVQRVL